MNAPTFHFVYFRHLLDECLIRFFDSENDKFFEDGRGNWIYGGKSDETFFRRFVEKEIGGILRSFVKPKNVLEPEYFFVIHGCEPKNNLLLKFENGYFPAKLRRAIWAEKNHEYVMKEKDLTIDLPVFNCAADAVFSELFSKRQVREKILGKNFSNVVFVGNSKFDCWTVFKTLKRHFGPRSCVNVFSEKFEKRKSCLVSLNDLIRKYVNGKNAMFSSEEYKIASSELIEFVSAKMEESAKDGSK